MPQHDPGTLGLARVVDAGDFVKVRFRLTRDEVGWPPVAGEGIWAWALGGDEYRIGNIPWFARGLASDDLVEAKTDAGRAIQMVSFGSSGGLQH
jgi:hypothetical protein